MDMSFHLMDIPSVGNFYASMLSPSSMSFHSSMKIQETIQEKVPSKSCIETPIYFPPLQDENKFHVGDFYFDALPLNLSNPQIIDPFSYEAYETQKYSKGEKRKNNEYTENNKKVKKSKKDDMDIQGNINLLSLMDPNQLLFGENNIKCQLKRGPKYMSKEERQLSKTEHLKLYQDIWRLLFRKNSTVTLSSLGSQCCSFYAHGCIDKCPSGKSDIFDFFRTAEHIWKVIEISAGLQERLYALEHFFFMKLLLPWKLQPRFTPCPSRPDVEALENDRVFQKGKIRGQVIEKQPREIKSKIEIRDLEQQREKVWNDLQKLENLKANAPSNPSLDTTIIPHMEYVFEILKKSIQGLDFSKNICTLWPDDPSCIKNFLSSCISSEHFINDETFGLEFLQYDFINSEKEEIRCTLLQCAKVLSSYGSLIRKCSKFNVDKGPLLKNPSIL